MKSKDKPHIVFAETDPAPERKRYAAILPAVEERATSHWYPYVKAELEKRGFVVSFLEMPEPNYPYMEERVATIHDFLRRSRDGDAYLFGHSIGGLAAMKAVEVLPKELKPVSGVVFVAALIDHLGFTHNQLGHTEHPERGQELVFGSFFPDGKKPDLAKISRRLRQATVIDSDNDPYIPAEHGREIVAGLNAEHVTLKEKGHMSVGVIALPEVIAAIEKQVRNNRQK